MLQATGAIGPLVEMQATQSRAILVARTRRRGGPRWGPAGYTVDGEPHHDHGRTESSSVPFMC